jgi:hypothetical protein
VRESEELRVIVVPDEEGAGAEELEGEFWMLDEGIGGGLEERWNGSESGFVGDGGFREDLNLSVVFALFEFGMEAAADALREHDGAVGLAGAVLEFLGKGIAVGVGREENESGLGTELADAEGEGVKERSGDGGTARGEGLWQKDEGIGAAHLREAGDGVWPGGCEVHEGASSAQGAGEADCFYVRVLDECGGHLGSGIEEEREDAGWEIAGGDGAGDDVSDQFAGAGVSGMSLDDDGIAGGERGGGVSASDGKGEREIAGSEDDDGSEWAEHGANVWAWQGLAGRNWRVNARLYPGAFFGDVGEEAQLAGGAGELALETPGGQAGLLHGALDKLLCDAFEAGGDGAQQVRSFCAGELAVGGKGIEGETGGFVDILWRGGMKERHEAFAGGGIHACEGGSGAGMGGGTDDGVSLEHWHFLLDAGTFEMVPDWS